MQEEIEEDIAKANFIESFQKQTYKEIFQKSNEMIIWWLGIIPNENKIKKYFLK